MMKNYRLLLLGVAGLLMAGCASVNVARNLNGQQLTTSGDAPIAHLNGDIYGYYLFGVWPLVTGDPADPDGTAWFTNTVTEQAAVDMVTRKSKELGAAKITDLSSRTDSTGKQTLFLIWYSSVQVSGNAVK